MLHKDEVLNVLADAGNVAQFVAYRPTQGGSRQTFSRLRDLAPNVQFATVADAVTALLKSSLSNQLNIRSYTPDSPKSREFIYGLSDGQTIVETVGRLSDGGLHVIINETIDVHDGGVSGVLHEGVIEFAPDNTPRCVEEPGTASLPSELGVELLSKVYGFIPELPSGSKDRTEFSLHPRRCGWKGTHTILWERESGAPPPSSPGFVWPNIFSKMIGDKVFGLMVADALGEAVPHTLVISRRVAPFWFGIPTGSTEIWTRTSPTEQQPGLFTTVHGWVDPFLLVATEDNQHSAISSVLRQDAVPSAWSGAAIIGSEGTIIEGRPGAGDRFMLGSEMPERLPENVNADVAAVVDRMCRLLGSVRIEWVHDGDKVWVVQLHKGATETSGLILVPGDARTWVEYRPKEGLASLRTLLDELTDDEGVLVDGEIGRTSHMADLLRKRGRPARIKAVNDNC